MNCKDCNKLLAEPNPTCAECVAKLEAENAKLKKRIKKLETKLYETYTDDCGTVWCRPTAEAYHAVCRARDKWQKNCEFAEKALELACEEINCEICSIPSNICVSHGSCNETLKTYYLNQAKAGEK